MIFHFFAILTNIFASVRMFLFFYIEGKVLTEKMSAAEVAHREK